MENCCFIHLFLLVLVPGGLWAFDSLSTFDSFLILPFHVALAFILF